MAKLCKLWRPKVYKRLYRSICEHAMTEITFAPKAFKKKKRSHVWLMWPVAKATQAFPYNAPSHTGPHDGRGTGGRRLWHFMKREALSGNPSGIVCLNMFVRERETATERAGEAEASITAHSVSKHGVEDKARTGGVGDHPPSPSHASSHAPVPVRYNGDDIFIVMWDQYARRISLAQILPINSYGHYSVISREGALRVRMPWEVPRVVKTIYIKGYYFNFTCAD